MVVKNSTKKSSGEGFFQRLKERLKGIFTRKKSLKKVNPVLTHLNYVNANNQLIEKSNVGDTPDFGLGIEEVKDSTSDINPPDEIQKKNEEDSTSDTNRLSCYNFEKHTNKVTKTFHLSRHLFSCNNLYEKMFFKKAYEPFLTKWGILSGLLLSQEREIEGNFKGKVYVSVLFRTWISAIIEFGPKFFVNKENEGKPLEIIVSPFIIEKPQGPGGIFLRGNMVPRNGLIKQVEMLNEFVKQLKILKELLTKKNSKIINQLLTNLTSDEKKEDLIVEALDILLVNLENIQIKICNGKDNYDYMITFVGGNTNKFVIVDNKPNFFYNFVLPKSINGDYEITDKSMEPPAPASITQDTITNEATRENGKYKHINPEDLKMINLVLNTDYKERKRNIYTHFFGSESFVLFLNWINCFETEEHIYVVCHSNLMKSILNKILELNEKDFTEFENKKVKEQNMWEMVLTVSPDNSTPEVIGKIESMYIREGINKPIKKTDDSFCNALPITLNPFSAGTKYYNKTQKQNKTKARKTQKRIKH
jgi:hypothetical protein